MGFNSAFKGLGVLGTVPPLPSPPLPHVA